MHLPNSVQFAVPEDVAAIIAAIHDFVDRQVVPLETANRELLADPRRYYRDDGRLCPELLDLRGRVRRSSAEAGFYTLFVPEQLGGSGFGPVAAFFVYEAIGRRYGPGRPLVSWAAGLTTSPLLASFVDGPSPVLTGLREPLRQRYLPGLMRGETGLCFALTEPDAGSDLWGLRTRARRDGDGWLIDGAKQWITNAPYADYALVFAVTDPDAYAAHRGGITCFFVEADLPGYAVEAVLPIFGHPGGDTGLIRLDGVRVDDDHVVGEPGRGFEIAMLGISVGRLSIGGMCTGLAAWALDQSLAYVRQRQAFGVPLAEHQAIQFMLADCAMDIYAARNMALHCAWKQESTGRLPVKEISMVKAFAVEACQRVMDRAIQMHGAMGLSNALPLQEGFRLARTLRIPDGTSEIQRRTVARQLLRGDTEF
ncbi:MAG: acyl-CoA/acyl-ACP dehydrogenase [Clostridia bacterium]|nr:acyl-CoA/acyl-ACP dehydrogenase [Clostridia bacterium]